MINLLPPAEKERLKNERTTKVITILWSFVLIFLVAVILCFVYVYFYINEKINEKRLLISDVEKSYTQTSLKDFQKELAKFNSDVEKIKNFYEKKKYVSDTIEKLADVIGEQKIYIKNFSFSLIRKEKSSLYSISITGFSPDREALFDFKKSLEEESAFSDIKFPQENWVKPTNINFEASFSIK